MPNVDQSINRRITIARHICDIWITFLFGNGGSRALELQEGRTRDPRLSKQYESYAPNPESRLTHAT
jgi:hypothetical protein